jgi:hypothetical protein
MMKCIRLVGLCLVSAFTIGAFAATGASADNPEYGRCVKEGMKEVSKYDSAKCIQLASEDPGTEEEKIKKGSFVWHPGPPANAGFTMGLKPSTIATLEYKSGSKMTCSGLSAAGEYTGTKTMSISQWVMSGCETGGFKCNTPGAGTGVIAVKALEGELGVIKKAKPTTSDKIGNVLWPAGGTPLSESEWVEFACGGITEKVKNSVIAPVTQNAMKLTATVKYTASKGEQDPESFEGEPDMFLEIKYSAAPYEQWGWSMTTIMTNEETVEIRSL